METMKPQVIEWRDQLKTLIVSLHPAWLFLTMAILPAFGFPLSLFYLAASALPLYLAFPLSLVALASSISIGYWLAKGVMNPFLSIILARSRWKIPQVSPGQQRSLIVMIRFSGMPFAFQNWILGMAGCSFPLYLVYSWFCQVPAAVAFLLLGESLWNGKGGLALAACMLLLFTMAAISFYRNRRKASGPASEEDPAHV